MSEPSADSNKRQGSWRSLLIWVLLALLLRWIVVEPRWIPSGSMLPTLQLQDRILVEKLRPRFDRARHQPLPLNSIVVFRVPEPLVQAGYDPDSALIKRVVGRPGDLLEVRDGQLRRNGEAVNEPWLNEAINYEMAPVTVPEDELWVMGDNRNASLDSHLWGPLPQADVIGTAILRYWPLSRFGPIRFSRPDALVTESTAAIGSSA
ncbi:Signal peptidase I P [Synechococcus sp. MIT S9509]|uniref:signal peptidase I n=1 Tax=unclassified Synechococcus TaxID=2626047 RepID=UPI0007BC6DD2|nr:MULTISPECIES: signal peptidase I [unclassified Synechococcus]KZR87417.1 Signal peptidase I P [Synechococcus sp. MIT S9504]KZR92819.1 Signal peptidase I P [Synechococcus sp. MIT S9509]